MGQSTSIDATSLPDKIDHDLFKKISGGLYDQAKFDKTKDENGFVTREDVLALAKKLSPIERMLLPPLEKLEKKDNLFDHMDVDAEKEKLLEKAQATSVGFMSFKKGLSRHAYSHAEEFKPRGPKVEHVVEIKYSPDTALLNKIEQFRKKYGPAHFETIAMMNELAELYRDAGEFQKTEAVYLDALIAQKMNLGKGHDDTVISMLKLSDFYIKRDQGEKAERLLADCLDVQKTKLGESHPETLQTMNNLANVYSKQMKKSQAEKLYVAHLELQEINLGLDLETENGQV